MGVLEQPGRGRLLVAALILLAVALALFATWFRLTHRQEAQPEQAARAVPGEGVRVQVEVLNATATVGLARSGTRRLRDAGLDVVYFGSDTTETLDSTLILVRRGSAAAGERTRGALGVGLVRSAPDAGRLVDVTVRLGRDFATLLRNP